MFSIGFIILACVSIGVLATTAAICVGIAQAVWVRMAKKNRKALSH